MTDDVPTLMTQLAKAVADRDHYRQLYLDMLERFRKLELGLLGQKSERLSADDKQLSLSMLAAMLAAREQAVDALDAQIGEASGDASDTAEPDDIGDDGATAAGDTQLVQGHTRRKPGRRPLPEDIPRIDVRILPPEVEAKGLEAFEQIGEETAEILERRSACFVIVRVIRPKFVLKQRDRFEPTTVEVASPPDMPIERGVAGPGLLADTIVRRWQDHMPLHRLEAMYAREAVEIPRSTMCAWHTRLADLAKPLLGAMQRDAFTSPLLCVDATGVLVQAKERCRHGHFWVVVAPEMHVLFHYSAKHDGAAVDRFLTGYSGHLVADAHAVYDHLYVDGSVTEVGCWAHCRRYFFKALGSDPERARRGLAIIKVLFELERKLLDKSRAHREAVRQKKSKVLVDTFFEWCKAEAPQVLDETPISKGLRYALNQERALRRFLSDGRLPVHNNISELQLRRQAVGRKNWLFVGNDDAGATNATFVSLLASCQMHRVEPWAYLRDLFCLLPRWPAKRILELAPAYWEKTRQQHDARQLLDADVFRTAVIGDARSATPATAASSGIERPAPIPEIPA